MEYQKNSHRSHDSIIEWVKLWGFGLVCPRAALLPSPGPGPRAGVKACPAPSPTVRELFQACVGTGGLGRAATRVLQCGRGQRLKPPSFFFKKHKLCLG